MNRKLTNIKRANKWRALCQDNARLMAERAELIAELRTLSRGRRGEHIHPGLDAVYAARALLAKLGADRV